MNEDSTKLRILEAARQLFVENGFAGTSMGKIAKLASVNHSLLYHHFVNKEGLWVAVKDSIVKKANKQANILPSTTLSWADFLAELIGRSISFYRENPYIAKLIHWQRVERDQKAQTGLTESEAAKEWIHVFEYYQKKGAIDKKHKPEFILTMIASIASSAAMDPNVFIGTPLAEKAYIGFLVEVLVQGLMNQQPERVQVLRKASNS